MDFDDVAKRMDALKDKFDPYNPEHVAEVQELWGLMLPTVNAVWEWMSSLPDIAMTKEYKALQEAFSQN